MVLVSLQWVSTEARFPAIMLPSSFSEPIWLFAYPGHWNTICDSLDDCYCFSIYRLSIGQAIAYEYTSGVVGLSPMVIHVEQFREICGDPLFCELKKHIMKYDELFKYY